MQSEMSRLAVRISSLDGLNAPFVDMSRPDFPMACFGRPTVSTVLSTDCL